jgi:hypothetical protein
VRKKVIWSPVEEEYLRKHRSDPVAQLSIALAKSYYSIKKKIKELDLPEAEKKSLAKKKKVRSKIGKRKDCNNLFFRSGWEANLYRLLSRDPAIRSLEYEPHTFDFFEFGVRRGQTTYTPDFKVTFEDGSYLWVEVKGYLKPQDKTKLRRFKKWYPDEFARLVAVAPGPTAVASLFFQELGVKIQWHYPELNKQYKNVIPHWE